MDERLPDTLDGGDSFGIVYYPIRQLLSRLALVRLLRLQ
jgi:hypothetical protein